MCTPSNEIETAFNNLPLHVALHITAIKTSTIKSLLELIHNLCLRIRWFGYSSKIKPPKPHLTNQFQIIPLINQYGLGHYAFCNATKSLVLN